MVDRKKIMEAVSRVAEEIKVVVQAVLAGNDLGDSQLYKDLQVDVEDIDLINITVNDYITYIQGGRKKGSGKGHFPGTKDSSSKDNSPSVEIIAEWCAKKGISTENDVVLAICWAIYWYGIKNGIPPRPLFEKYEGGWESDEAFPISEAINSHWDEWQKQICDAIMSNLDKEFNKKIE